MKTREMIIERAMQVAYLRGTYQALALAEDLPKQDIKHLKQVVEAEVNEYEREESAL